MSIFQVLGILVGLLVAYAIYRAWVSSLGRLIASWYVYEFYPRLRGVLSDGYKREEVIYFMLPRLLVGVMVFVFAWWLLQNPFYALVLAYVMMRLSRFGLDRYGLLYLGRSQAKKGQFAAAIETYQQLLQKFGRHANVLYDLGSVYAKAAGSDFPEGLKQALGTFEECLQRDPKRWKAHLQKGHVLLQMDKLHNARLSYLQAQLLQPQNPTISYGLGQSAYLIGHVEQAVAKFQEALQQDPHHAASHLGVGVIYEQQKKIQPALAAYEKAGAYLRLGILYCKQGEYSSARDNLLKALAGGNEDRDRDRDRDQDQDQDQGQYQNQSDSLLYYLGFAFSQCKQYKEALEVWGVLQECHPDDSSLTSDIAQLHYLLGDEYLKAEKYAEAARSWEAYLAIRENEEVRRQLADVFFRWAIKSWRVDGNSNYATAAFLRAIELNQGHRPYQYALALCELGNEQLEASTARLRRLLKAEAERPDYLYHLALALLKQKQVEKGEPLLRRVLAEAKEPELIEKARALLASLWEQMQKDDPTSLWVAHQLAILYHRWAIELEEKGQTEAADARWRQAIGNWVLLIEADGFWERWQAEREAVYESNIQITDMDKVRRQQLPQRLIQIHRDFERAYSQLPPPGANHAARHKEYRLLLTWELKSAAALRDTAERLQEQGQTLDLPLIAGPLMLSQLGMLEQAREIAQSTSLTHLAEYLSPLGRFYLLIEEGEADRAIAELLLEKDQRDPEVVHLLGRALKEAGKTLLSNRPQQAISMLLQALKYDPPPDIAPLLVQACLKQATLLQRDDLNGAINILNLGLDHLPNDQKLKENLSSLLTLQGIQQVEQERWQEAHTSLQKAIQLDQHNEIAKQKLATLGEHV
ncbi:MAG: tetratricopeptide repeat protein [Ardenticatenaceae bacterium]